MKILSPMATGNGAYIVHRMLAENIQDYSLIDYSPYLTIFPPLLSRAVPSCKSDLIHTTPDYSTFFTQKDTPMIITFHNYVLDPFMEDYSSILQRIHYKSNLRYLTRKAINRAIMVTAVSEFTANIVKKDLNHPGQVRVIYNGIDSERFLPLSGNKREKRIRVLFCGNLSRRKGASFLPDIAKRLNEGIEIQYTTGLMDRKQRQNASNLQSIGSVRFDDMPQVYRQADILLFPTVREGFGLAAAEAMSCGLPVVATDCSSIPELVVHGKGGFLCPLGDVEYFAEKINLLADSANLRKEMGQFNRARVENKFTIGRMVREYEQLFQEALGPT